MNSLFLVFLLSLGLSLLLTPMARLFGLRIKAMDFPNDRKHHSQPKPRTGGLAILISFYGALCIVLLAMDLDAKQILLQRETLYLAAGSILCFLIGFIDDIKRQSALIKLVGQIVAASLAFYGGVRISLLPIAGTEISLWFSYFQTIFWFLLFINAINLIDGLDGLAAGISLFTCLMLIIFSLMRGNLLLAMPFTALAGVLVGFLRYNFNPSTIFMGDGGSYFLGFIIAGLAVLGSAKGHLSAVFLMPFIAMGVPIFDTLITPVRRFVLGRKVFSPDNGHIHHKLIAMGLTTRKAVLSLYLLTTILGLGAIFVVNMKNEIPGFILVLGAVALLLLFRSLGTNRFSVQGAGSWLRDLADVAGLSQERRIFLDLQLKIKESSDIHGLWDNACAMLRNLSIDFAEIRLTESLNTEKGTNCDKQSPTKLILTCTNELFDPEHDLCRPGLFKLELPLITKEGYHLGQVWIIKDIHERPIDPYTLMRLELFRRTVITALIPILPINKSD